MAERIALYGGSFNPVHCGHVIISRAIAERLNLDRVIFFPSATPPHKEADALADAEHRAQMVRLAIKGEAIFGFSDFDLKRSGPSYTIDTIQDFRNRLGPGTRLHWIIGADSLPELPFWHRIGELVDLCEIVTAARAGLEPIDWDQLRLTLNDAQIGHLRQGILDTPIIEVSSTDIRSRIRTERSIRYLVPDAVISYIERHGLYSDTVE